MHEIIDDNIINENVELDLVQASGTKRFLNYIIDRAIAFGITMGIAILLPTEIINYFAENSFADKICTFIFYGIIMGLIEGFTRGNSVGKLLTGTLAINEDGSTITFAQGMQRGFCRIIPFEPFSAFGDPSYPWHDKFTGTYVIDKEFSNY